MKNYTLVINYDYCTGCHSCEVACRNEQNLALDQWGIKISEFGPMKLDGKWEWNNVPVPTSLCDLCIDRIEQGLEPACVQSCLAACMEAVPTEEVPARLAALGKKTVCFIP